MTQPHRCICKGKPLHELLAPAARRLQTGVEEGTLDGHPASFDRVAFTLKLVQALSQGKQWAFDARFRNHDHHLRTCPCSPYYEAPEG